MIFNLPDIRSDFDGFSRLAELSHATKDCVFETISIDFSSTVWFDANMCAPLGVIFARIGEALSTIELRGLSQNVERILSRNLFLRGFGYPSVPDRFKTTIPYRRIKPEDSRYFVAYINKHLENKRIPKMSEELSRRFKDAILETFVNSAMHSETKLGIFSCGQLYPTEDRLDFSIADAGIGIRRKLIKELNLSLNSDKAIQWAIQEGNTTRRGGVPGGLGLKLLQEFVALNKGNLQIVSDRGFWQCDKNGIIVKRLEYSFPGTVINLEINTADEQSYCLQSENN